MMPMLQTLPSRPQLSRKRSSTVQLYCPSCGSTLAQSSRITPMPKRSSTSLGCLSGNPPADQPLPGLSKTPETGLGSTVTVESTGPLGTNRMAWPPRAGSATFKIVPRSTVCRSILTWVRVGTVGSSE
jgi:hypothetical protein